MNKFAEARPEPVDVIVGARIAARRRALGLSQSDLARALTITFQQVQKYERGVNRVSASKLWATAKFLRLPVEALFPQEDSARASDEAETGATAESIAELIQSLSPADQALVLTLARRLQSEQRTRKLRRGREFVEAD
jgi:transcriptional regulator with XRE-family HTH domain